MQGLVTPGRGWKESIGNAAGRSKANLGVDIVHVLNDPSCCLNEPGHQLRWGRDGALSPCGIIWSRRDHRYILGCRKWERHSLQSLQE